jgi:hypothetical protein
MLFNDEPRLHVCADPWFRKQVGSVVDLDVDLDVPFPKDYVASSSFIY